MGKNLNAEDKLKETAEIFKAFSEEFRLRVLAMLADGREICVCKLSEVLKATNSKTSRHLAYLKRIKIVSARRKGQWMYYKLNPKIDAKTEKLFEAIKPFIIDNPQSKKDIKKLDELEEIKNCKTIGKYEK